MTATTDDAPAILDADAKPLGGRVGAVIHGIRISGDLSAAAIARLEDLLLRDKVLFFRDQHLNDATPEAFEARFGAPFAHPTQGAPKGTASVLDLDTQRSGEPEQGRAGGARADQWHIDITFLDAYPRLSILRNVIAPASGGDTVSPTPSRPTSSCPNR